MTGTDRPRRSALFVPGSNPRALDKARTLPADVLLFDLEDAVAPAAKALARDQVGAALGQGGYGARERVVRVNAVDGPWFEKDLEMAARAAVDAVLLPKVERAETVRMAEQALEDFGGPEATLLWCMVETPLGVLRAADVSGASPRLAALIVGTSDLVKDLGAQHTPSRHEVVTSLGLCLLAARAFGLAVLDGVHLDLSDTDGFEIACRQAREMGFDGKTLIHPKTIEIANRVFSPTPDEIARAERIIEAHAAAEGEGRGVAVVDGCLVESLHVDNARRLLALDQAIRARGGPETP